MWLAEPIRRRPIRKRSVSQLRRSSFHNSCMYPIMLRSFTNSFCKTHNVVWKVKKKNINYQREVLYGDLVDFNWNLKFVSGVKYNHYKNWIHFFSHILCPQAWREGGDWMHSRTEVQTRVRLLRLVRQMVVETVFENAVLVVVQLFDIWTFILWALEISRIFIIIFIFIYFILYLFSIVLWYLISWLQT
jgi:hypothetical protein